MNITKVIVNDMGIAIINSDDILITDVQSALDLMATVHYEADCDRMILNQSAICEDFYSLSTQLAGDILQKYMNYRVKIAIVGDFSKYSSKNFKDFIYECNNGKDIFFLSNEEQALDKLSSR